MTLLHKAVDSKKFDTRVVERNIQKGFIRPEDHHKVVAELPDDSANAEWCNVETLMNDNSGSAQSNNH